LIRLLYFNSKHRLSYHIIILIYKGDTQTKNTMVFRKILCIIRYSGFAFSCINNEESISTMRRYNSNTVGELLIIVCFSKNFSIASLREIEFVSCHFYAGYCVFVDAEHALDPALAQTIGVKTDKLLLSQPDCGEQALSLVDTLIRSGSVDVVVIDSVSLVLNSRFLLAVFKFIVRSCRNVLVTFFQNLFGMPYSSPLSYYFFCDSLII
jgi:hypothetical protein